jgi:hypothetical protein
MVRSDDLITECEYAYTPNPERVKGLFPWIQSFGETCLLQPKASVALTKSFNLCDQEFLHCIRDALVLCFIRRVLLQPGIVGTIPNFRRKSDGCLRWRRL